MDIIQFQDRTESAKQLSKLLDKFRGTNSVILGIPRGGVVTANVLAKELYLPFGMIVVKKISHPLNPEYAIGAISESGVLVKNEDETKSVDPKWLEEESKKQLEEAKRRREKYWGDRDMISLAGKTAIIVDDGLATGLTMEAALQTVKQMKPKMVVIAVPVAPKDTAEKFKAEVDEFISVYIPDPFEGAVANYYRDFGQVEDEAVIKMVNESFDPKVFYMAEFKKLAREIAKIPEFSIGNYKLIHFPNEEIQVQIQSNVKNQATVFLGTIAPPHEQMLETFLTCHTLRKEGAKSILAVFPYLAYMRHDRNKSKEDQAVDMIAKLAKEVGITEMLTIDIHSKQAMDLFEIPIFSLSPATIFAQKIKELNFGATTIVSPDEGAIERAQSLKKELKIKGSIVIFSKTKKDKTSVSSTLYKGKIGEKVIIVDDILDTGRTLLNCVRILRKKGAKEIVVAVTHGLFTGEKWKKLFDCGVTKIITTDSVPKKIQKYSDKIVVLDCSLLIIGKLKK